MSITVKKISARRDIKAFIRFNYRLYKDCDCAVPDFYEDLRDTFNPARNPAYEFCEADLFLAYDEAGRIVGRVAALINHKANRTWGTNDARFGWIDFVDDPRVSAALLATVEGWAREHGKDRLVGPLGFTDLDPEGMLTGGYDRLGTMATIYNYPYYPQHMERLGFDKEVDWVEREVTIPDATHAANSAKYFRVAEMSARRYNLHVRKIKSIKELHEGGYGRRIFGVVNKAYAPLYGFSEMNGRQIDQYINTYLPFVDLRLITIIENEEGEPVAMGVSMPSLSRALQKAKGRLFPFGWWHLLRAIKFKHSPVLDLLLVAVLPEYQNKGVNAMIFADLIPIAQEMGFKTAETHPQLETNEKSQGQWAYLDVEVHKQRRCYKKDLK